MTPDTKCQTICEYIRRGVYYVYYPQSDEYVFKKRINNYHFSCFQIHRHVLENLSIDILKELITPNVLLFINYIYETEGIF